MMCQSFGSNCKVFGLIVLALALFTPALALAQQPAHDLQALQSSIRAGDSIRIDGADGKTVQGIVESLSGASLRLKVKGISREFREPQIREIKVRYNDPIGDGIRMGAIVGGIAGAAIGAAISDAFCDGCGNNQAGGAVGLGLVGVGIGAGTGALADSLTKSYKSVFKASETAGKQFSVSPILSRKTKGVAVAFRF